MAQPLDLQLPSASAVQAAGAPAPGGGSTSFAELLQQQQQQVVMTSEQAALAALAGAIGHSATALLAQGKAAAGGQCLARAGRQAPGVVVVTSGLVGRGEGGCWLAREQRIDYAPYVGRAGVPPKPGVISA